MAIKFSNNASSKLVTGITAIATTLDVLPTTGALFPSLGAGDYFYCTLVDTSGNIEIVKVTARSGDTFTVVRAQEGTTSRAYPANSVVEQRFTAGSLTEVLSVPFATNAEATAQVLTYKAVTPANLPLVSVKHADDAADLSTGSVLSVAKGGTGTTSSAGISSLLNLSNAATIQAVSTSAGAADAGKIPLLDSTGKLSNTIVLPVPAGTVIYVAGTNAPTGYLKGNGAAVSRTTYADLYAVIGTTYGVGDGSTTFNLPDYRGYFLRCWDDSRGVDTSRVLGSTQGDAFQSHIHGIRIDINEGNGDVYAGQTNTSSGRGEPDSVSYGKILGPSTDGAYGTPRVAAETRPKNISVLACIKY